MKQFLLAGCCVGLIIFYSSCSQNYHDGNTNISISETKSSYTMYAHFDKSKTTKVRKYMDEHLGKRNNISFVNTEVNANLTLDDKTKFYIKSSPGELKIKLDKEENSFESYTEIK